MNDPRTASSIGTEPDMSEQMTSSSPPRASLRERAALAWDNDRPKIEAEIRRLAAHVAELRRQITKMFGEEYTADIRIDSSKRAVAFIDDLRFTLYGVRDAEDYWCKLMLLDICQRCGTEGGTGISDIDALGAHLEIRSRRKHPGCESCCGVIIESENDEHTAGESERSSA